MIELRTGVPRQGKTLHMVQQLANLLKRWEKHPGETRPVFVHQIDDLALKHSPLPLKSIQIDKAGTMLDVPDWDAIPNGSLVLIDECDKVFPPRAAAVAVPYHVQWLTEHGHLEIDIWLTTQHPSFIDSKVRKLVGKHQHFRRLFGRAKAVIYEWDTCSENLSGFKNAVISYFPYPKNIYQYYKSAVGHTKQSFTLPKWLLIPVFGLALGAFFLPKAFGVLTNGITGKGVSPQPQIATKPAVNSPTAPIQAKGGALAPPVAQNNLGADEVGFNDGNDEQEERSIDELKISYAVYSDDPKVTHLTHEQLKKQRTNSVILDDKIDSERFAFEVQEYENQHHITVNERERVGSYSF